MQSVDFSVHVTRDDDGAYFAEVDQLPGCFASGHTPVELESALIEAIGMYLTNEHTYAVFVPVPGQLAEAVSAGRTSVELVSA